MLFNTVSPPIGPSGGSMTLFIIPIIVFVLTSSVCYYFNSNSETKEGTETKYKEYLKIGAPGILLAVLVFLIIKYKDVIVHSEPVMTGNYFD
jgi:hypothetical protein